MTIGVGRNRDGPSCCAGNQLHARSNRSAPCSVSAIARPLLLDEHAVPGHPRVVHPRRDRLRQLVRHAVVEAVGQVLVVRHPRAVVGHERVLIADLQAVRARDVRRPTLPQIRPGVRDAEILRSIDQAGDVAVRGAAARALFGDADQAARRDSARARSCRRRRRCRRSLLDEQAVRERRGPRRLRRRAAAGRARRPPPARCAAARTVRAWRRCTSGTVPARPRSR